MTHPAPGIIWASLPIPALLVDAQNRIADANPAAETFFTASSRSLRDQPLLHRLTVDAPLDEALLRVRDNQSALFVEDVLVTIAERPAQHCNIQIAPLNDESGTLLLLISSREIAGRIGRANLAKSAAKSAIGMADILAHEIKNPLAGIAGAAQLIAMSASPEDRELTDLIVDETRRIVKLLEQVEQFGNLRPPERRSMNIHDLLDRARKSALVGFAARMQIIEDYDPSLPLTLVDGDQMVQVFLNLLKNAAEAAGPGGGTLRLHTFYDMSLRLRRKDAKLSTLALQVEIIDDGPGIPPDIAADIFEPFVSGRANGTGLGLALVSKIISDHEGWITADSVPGRTAFRISLPIAPKQTEVT